MASEIGDGDYLGAYRRFFVDFLDKVIPDDQLPITTNGHDVYEEEIVGEIIHMTLQYLNQQICPPSLQGYIVQLVIEEIKAMCRKQRSSCGYKETEQTYAPLKLMQAVTSKVNEICQNCLVNSRLALLPPPPSSPMPFVASYAIRNNRRKMEDRHVILHDLNTIFNIKSDIIASYYAVFDGHAGHRAAAFCATHLHQYLAESRHYPTDPERALRDAFLTTDARFIKKSRGQALSSGTTAVTALILDTKLYIAWVGDSQAALAKRGNVTQLVNPHKPEREDERNRVEEMGGSVMFLGIWRVNGILAVSRAIGDVKYKPYVTGDPDVRCVTLDGQEDFLIIACDGLWDYVTEEEAATFVYQDLCRDPHNYDSSSQRLTEHAKKQGSIDNITIIIVYLATPRQIASRYPYNNSNNADVQLRKMDPDNRYASSNANGQYVDVNSSAFASNKLQAAANNCTLDPLDMDDPYVDGNFAISTPRNGKRHEKGDRVADYDAEEDDDDLGPETDVDAVDDMCEETNLANVSRQLFTEKLDSSEFTDGEPANDDSSTTKTNQQALIPEADNVGDSEDSEDEWNYYRIDPNKREEKAEEAGTAGFSPLPKSKNPINDDPSLTNDGDNHQQPEDEDNDIVNETGKKDTDSSSDCESDNEISSPKGLIDTEISVEKLQAAKSDSDEEEEKRDDQKEDTSDELSKHIVEDMDFQLNPDAAEFVPVSPTITIPAAKIEDVDAPLAGSPLKKTAMMDDIKIPSQLEFEYEVRSRPHEIEEKNCTNGQLLDDSETTAEKTAEVAANLDESEVSSTKAEFGDESSFLLTASETRKGSDLGGSFTGSYDGFDDSTVDPMTKSYGPGDFMNLSDPVDLNAVHDLTEVDTMETDENRDNENPEIVGQTEQKSTPSNANYECLLDDIMEGKYAPPTEVLHPEQSVDSEKSNEIINVADNDDEECFAAKDIPSDQQETENVTTKLLEMDLEDRGSQDCGFEKCNEKVSAEYEAEGEALGEEKEKHHHEDKEQQEETSELLTNAITDHFSSPVTSQESPIDQLQESPIDQFQESLPVEATQNAELPQEDILADSLSEKIVAPDVGVFRNPFSMYTGPPSPESHPLLDYSASTHVQKVPESPEVPVSPLVESQNPFLDRRFGTPKENDHHLETVDESVPCVYERLSENTQICDSTSDSTPFDKGTMEIDQLAPETRLIPETETENIFTEEKITEPIVQIESAVPETQLITENVTNGMAEVENLLDIHNEDTKIEQISNEDKIIAPVDITEEVTPQTRLIAETVSNGLAEVASLIDTHDEQTKTDEKITEPIVEEPPLVASIQQNVEATKNAEVKIEPPKIAATPATGTKATKTKPAAGKPIGKTSTATKTANKSTPTSPTKAATTARVSTLAATKKSATAAHPTKLETAGKTTTTTVASKTTAAGKPSATAKPTAGRLHVPTTKAKSASSPLSTKTAAPLTDNKKATTNGEATKTAATSRVSSTRVTSTKSLVKTSSAAKTTSNSSAQVTSTTTTSTTSSRPKTATTTSRTSTTTTKSTSVGTTTQSRPKTAPSTGTSSLAKTRLAPATKAPITEKHIKETANKQISSSRSTSLSATAKTSRTSGVSATATKRTTLAAKNVAAAAAAAAPTAVPPPIRKPASATRVSSTKTTTTTSNGKTITAAKTTSKIEVVENGVCVQQQEVTKIVTSGSNEEDVPKKDVSPVEQPTDNQLIVASD